MLKLRLMTLNLGGGIKNYRGSPQESYDKSEAISELINRVKPDVLGVQEIAQYLDGDGHLHSMTDLIRYDAQFGHAFYGETLSMKQHLQVKQALMVEGLFNDWWDWSKGNAVFSHIPFARLGDTERTGVPRNVPVFQPVRYEGTRDTDPRYVIVTRLKNAPFPFVLNLHLTTLVGERGENAWEETIQSAEMARSKQILNVLGLIEKHVLIPGEPIILMGDFNAKPDEYTLKNHLIEENNFVRLVPENDIPTHGNAGSVDHIYFAPANRLVSYSCHVIDDELTRRVSDHLPVVADIEIR